VVDSEFNHTGLREYGMGVSVGGLGKDVRVVNCDFTDSPNRAVEFIGTDGVKIIGNCFQNNNASIVVTKNIIVTNQLTKNVEVIDNVVEGSEEEGFIEVENLMMNNNIFKIQGRMKFENVKEAKIKSLHLDTDAYAALEVGGLKNFDIYGSSIENRRSGNVLIRIEADNMNFTIRETDLFTGVGQSPYGDLSGAISAPKFLNVAVYDLKRKLIKKLEAN